MTRKLRLTLASVLAVAALGAIAPAASAYIYWTNGNTGTIGRANLNGGSPNQSFITGASDPFGLAVDGNYIYWTNLDTNTIGRANLDGTGANPSFITGASNP
jgi:membrane-bound inhibitor of C-type lysozyme